MGIFKKFAKGFHFAVTAELFKNNINGTFYFNLFVWLGSCFRLTNIVVLRYNKVDILCL